MERKIIEVPIFEDVKERSEYIYLCRSNIRNERFEELRSKYGDI